MAGSAAPKLPCPEEPITQQDILDLFDRLLPLYYLDPWKSGQGPGYELLQAFGALMERASRAVVNVACGSYISTADGGAYSELLVEFSRPTAAGGAVTVKAGTVLQARSGRDFFTVEDAEFGPLDLGPIEARARAVAQAYEWNVPGEVTTADGTVLPGDIDTVRRWVLEPPFGDATITVKNVDPATGGRAAMLDQLGADRGVLRLFGEHDNPYRARIRGLPNTVTPDAVKRAAMALFDQFGLTTAFIETFDVTYQTCWDGPHVAAGSYDPTLFAYDDPRPALPFRNRWLDDVEHRKAFIFVVPNLAALADVGMGYDDTALTPADLVSPSTQGQRAVGAYDVPTFNISSELQGGYDGFDLVKQSVYKGLFDLLQSIKAAGVAAILELEGN